MWLFACNGPSASQGRWPDALRRHGPKMACRQTNFASLMNLTSGASGLTKLIVTDAEIASVPQPRRLLSWIPRRTRRRLRGMRICRHSQMQVVEDWISITAEVLVARPAPLTVAAARARGFDLTAERDRRRRNSIHRSCRSPGQIWSIADLMAQGAAINKGCAAILPQITGLRTLSAIGLILEEENASLVFHALMLGARFGVCGGRPRLVPLNDWGGTSKRPRKNSCINR